MKKYIYALCALTAGLFLYTSCISSDDDTDVIQYDDTAVTAFTLAAVNRYVHTTSSKGQDSVYKVALANPVAFSIDHYRQKIYNTDSLPFGCDLRHVLANISSKNGGTIVIKSLTSDTLKYYTASDSIDFSSPRELRVYTTDGSVFRSYEVTVNVHKTETGILTWQQMQPADFPVDGEKARWEERVATAGLKQFIGAGTAEAYAFSEDGTLMVSRDQGITWTADELDEHASLLPTEFAFASCPFKASVTTDYQLLIGTNSENENSCVVWRKLAEYGPDSEPSKWVFLPVENYNKYFLPKMENLNLVCYKGHVLAIGNDGNIYESRDRGITWKTTKQFTLPATMATHNVSATADTEGHLWLRNKDDGNVWRGSLTE